MSTKSPLSTICLVACANRASSRSIAGILKKPGRKSTMPQSARNTMARKWLTVAKSNAATSLRLEFAGFTGCWPAPKRGGCKVSTMLFAYDETAMQTTPQIRPIRLSPVAFLSLYPDHNGIGRPRRVDHRQPGKARPGRIDQALAPAVDFADRGAVQHDGQRQHAAGDLDRHRRGLPAA